MNVLVLDLETTTAIMKKRKASPFHPDNWIVAAGFGVNGEKPYGDYYDEPSPDRRINLPDLDNVDIIVGHNLKFDLLYLWKHPQLKAFIKKGGKIWCTQYAEYLIRGMVAEVQMNALGEIALQYGGSGKIDAVKEMWNSGIDTPDIPRDLLMDYLLGNPDIEINGDIGDTWLVYKGQQEIIQGYPEAFTAMIANRMDSLLATTEMEYNGLYVNRDLGESLRNDLAVEVDALTSELETFLPELPTECIFNWRSIYDKSYLIYGGVKKYQKWVQHTDPETGELLYANKTEKWPLFRSRPVAPRECPNDKDITVTQGDNGLWYIKRGAVLLFEQDTYKSGKRQGEGKTKNVTIPDKSKPKGAKRDHFFTFPGYTSPNPKWKSSLTDGAEQPIFSTSGDIIELLGTRNIPFLKSLAKRAKFTKDLGTYYWEEDKNGKRKGMLTQVGDDAIIHHSLNHTSTVTGRMSSSNPNLQNIPRKGTSNVKQMFESRFGESGYIVEMDYSALEVYVQAVLTRCRKMQEQIKSGIDFHCFRLSVKLNENYDDVYRKCKDENDPHYKSYDAQRTAIKGFSFQLAYGAGAAAIAESIGLPVDDVKELIRLEHETYPEIGAFDAMLEEAINDNFRMTERMLYVKGHQYPAGEGHWFSPTGTRYVWQEHETPEFLHDRGKFIGFSPTERKNYPVQGFGGEIMQTMLGVLYRWFVRNENFNGKALLVNTVHDSVYLDIHKSIVHQVVPTCCTILAAVHHKYNRDFPNLNMDLQFAVDADIGPSMFKLTGYKPETTYDK